MRFEDIARSLEQHQHNALALRHQHLFRSRLTRGGSIAAVYSRPPWRLDYEFAPDSEPRTQTLWIGLQRLDDIVSMWRVMTDATQKTVSSRIDSG